MSSRIVALCAGIAVVTAVAIAHAADPVAEFPSARELRESMLASDSILVARVDLDLIDHTDSTGKVTTDWKSKRVAINQVKNPWMKRFVAAFLPEGSEVRAELCGTPRTLPGAAKPWMLTALWITPSGRGQAYLDFSTRCAIAGLQGRGRAGVAFDGHADSLFALFREALYSDSLLVGATSVPPAIAEPTNAPAAVAAPAHMPEPVTRVAPEYPSAARAQKVEGTVLVEALVATDGHVAETHIKEGVPRLNAAALAAVRRWRFKPATDAAGAPMEARVIVPVQFSLESTAAPKPH